MIEFRDGGIFRKVTREEWQQIADGGVGECGRLGGAALDLLARDISTVGLVGLGCGVLPRLLNNAFDVMAFEIEPEVVARFRQRHPWCGCGIIEGDFKDTIKDHHFDVIVYDLGDTPPDWLAQHGEVIVP